jgi:O-antigen/teichoic acid export membrane protein
MYLETPPLKKITRNVFSIVVGQGTSLLLNFLSIPLMARYLGVGDFGNFNYLLAISALLSKLVDFGLTPIVFRETSRNKNDYSFIHSAILLRLIMLVLVVVLFNITAALLQVSTIEILLCNMMMINVIISSKFQNIREILDIPFKVELKMHYPMAVAAFDNLLFLIFVLLAPQFGGGLNYFVTVYIISNIPGFLFIIFMLKRKFEFKLNLATQRISYLVKESLPIYGYVILITIFSQVDILFLKNFNSEYATGIYSAAMKLTIPFSILPSAIVATIFPIIVKNRGINDEQNRKTILISFKLLLLISATLALAGSFKASEIMTFIFGAQYHESGTPMILLFWAQVFLFYNYLALDLFTAFNRQSYTLFYGGIIVVTNVSFLLLLLPQSTYVGVGIAKLVSTFIGFLFLSLSAYKLKMSFKFLDIRIIGWIILAASSIYVASVLPLFPYLLITSIIILMYAKLLKYFSDEEILLLFKLFNKEKWGQKLIRK